MLKILFIIITFKYSNGVPQNLRVTELDLFSGLYRNIREEIFNRIGRNSDDRKHMELARSLGKLQDIIPDTVPFPCNVTGFRSGKPPTNVNQLRPGDIDIIAAIGDSLTAGYGLVATTILQVLMENRGLSWSIGGQGTWREFLTLANILKEFNPNLFGYSLRDSYTYQRDSQFNVAEGGAMSWETPYMTQVLIKRIKSDPRVNLKEHWKLVTYMIGSNDFCLDVCFRNDLDEVLEDHRKDLLIVLRLLKDNLPRTIVNIVPPPNIEIVKKFINTPVECEAIRRLECYCLFASRFQKYLNKYYEYLKLWQKLEEDIASMTEFQQNDFAVVYQPFLIETDVPLNDANETDFTYLSQDCFHLSQKTNARANDLWNNMLQPVGRKKNYSDPLFEKFLCPTEENPYIFTQSNSNVKEII